MKERPRFARASERDQAVSFAKDVDDYAAEATQTVEELQRISTTQVIQAQWLKDHMKNWQNGTLMKSAAKDSAVYR